MRYEITEKQLKSINMLIKVVNIAIKRGDFSKEEVDKIIENIKL